LALARRCFARDLGFGFGLTGAARTGGEGETAAGGVYVGSGGGV
jgi:hypothetical protein